MNECTDPINGWVSLRRGDRIVGVAGRVSIPVSIVVILRRESPKSSTGASSSDLCFVKVTVESCATCAFRAGTEKALGIGH
jgi:hypothetical protein